MEKIAKIAVTGGPCSGKTLGIKYVVKRLKSMAVGWQPLVVPEAATILFGIGEGIYDMRRIVAADPRTSFLMGKRIVDLQLDLKDGTEILAGALSDGKIVVLYDRGLADNIGYGGSESLEKILRARGVSFGDIYKRYDAVIHLVTAALGAEKYYSNKSNRVRYESLEEARDLDRRILAGWRPHKNLTVIDNSTGFRKKKERLFQAVCGILGIEPE